MADTAAPAAASAPAENVTADARTYLDSLVQKHATEIYNEIKQNKTIEQQKQLWLDNGIDPDMLMASYPELIEKSELLRKDNIVKTRKAKNIGEITTLGALTTLLLLPNRIYNNNPLVKAVFSALGAMSSGVLTYLGATRILTRENRHESTKVSVQARDVLIYNLALLYETRERRELAGQPLPPSISAKKQQPENDSTHAKMSAYEAGVVAAKQSLAAARAANKDSKPSYVERLKAEEAAQSVINKSIN